MRCKPLPIQCTRNDGMRVGLALNNVLHINANAAAKRHGSNQHVERKQWTTLQTLTYSQESAAVHTFWRSHIADEWAYES